MLNHAASGQLFSRGPRTRFPAAVGDSLLGVVDTSLNQSAQIPPVYRIVIKNGQEDRDGRD